MLKILNKKNIYNLLFSRISIHTEWIIEFSEQNLLRLLLRLTWTVACQNVRSSAGLFTPSLQSLPANWVTGIMLILRLEAGHCHGQTCHDYHSTDCLARLPILRWEHSDRDISYQTSPESSVKINFRGNIITLQLATTRISNIFLSHYVVTAIYALLSSIKW